MTDVTLRIRGDATGVVRASADASRAVSGIEGAAQQAGAAGQRAGRQIAEGAGQAEQASQRAAQAMRGLVATAAAAFGSQQLLQLAGIADQYGQISARLKAVIGDSMALASAQDAVFAVAQRTRSELAATSDLVSGLARSYAAAGLSSEQAFATSLRLTEAINNALVTSGTSAASASGLITQLNQALSSGVLRGDEFNSVMEASPRLAQAMAAGLDVPIGRLRAMAEAGELTRDRVTAALTGVEWDKLAAEAAAMPLTLAQGWQQVTNAFQQYVGRANAEAGATSAVAEALGLLAENMTAVVEGALRLSVVIAAGFGINALLPVLAAFSAQMTAAGSAALGTATALTAVNLAMTGLLTAGLAFVAGWQVGTYLREQFVEVEVAGIGMVTGLMRAYERLRSATEAIGATIEIAFGNASSVARLAISDLLRAFADFATVELPAGLRADFTFGAADGIRRLAAEMEAGVRPTRSYQEAWDEIGSTLDKNLAAVDKVQTEMLDAAIETRKAGAAAVAAATDLGKLESAAGKVADEAGRAGAAMRAVADASGAVGIGLAGASSSVGAFAGATAQAATGSDELARRSQQAAAETERYWSGAAGAISDAFGDFVASGLKSFSDFGRDLKRIAQQIISDLVAQFAQSRIVIPIMAAVGLGGPGVAAASQGVGGSVGGIGGGTLGGILGGIGGALGGFTAGLGVAGSAGLAAATNFGLASVAAGNFAVGLGALAGSLGPIGLALGGINAITGGRLFGTSYRTNAAGQQFNFSESGASGFNFEEQSRRRSLFRGTRRRTVESALGEDAQAQIDAFFEQVGVAVSQAAEQLGIDVPPRIAASFRRTTDAQGNVISEVGTILGRQYNESFEVFSRRIAAENVIGVLDAALDGEAGRIAEAWRGSADTLADGAQFLLNAATDMRGGFQLLGDASLTGVAEFVQRLAGDGESLTAAYARISGATVLLTEAVGLMGVDLGRTREQFVEFAADIAEAAGGLEQAQGLWRGYFESFYSEQERGLVMLQQARQRGTAQAAGIGLDLNQFTGTGGMQAFRELFESRLPTLSADQVVAWLQFGSTLSNITDLQARYTDAVAQTAETIGEFMGGIDAALGEFAAAPGLEQQLAAQREANQALIDRAVELGASEAELARVRQLGDQRINAIIGSVSQQTTTLSAALRRLGIAAVGSTEQFAVAASGLSDDFGALFEEALGSLYTDAERAAMRQTLAQSNLSAALQAAGLSTEDIISRTELRIQIEAALAAGNYKLAESLLRVSRAMDQVDQAANGAANSTQQLVNNGNGSQFGAGGGGSGLGFGGDGPTGGAAGGLVDDIEAIRRGLRDWLTSLTTGDLSPERPREQLRRAQAEYQRLLTAAAGGDADALRQLQGASEQVLRLGRQVFGSSAAYTSLYNQILAQVGGLVGFGGGPIGGGGGSTRPVDDLGDSASRAAAALDALADRLGMPAGSLTVPSPQFGGVSDQQAAEASARPVVAELQRGQQQQRDDAGRLRAELAAMREEMAELRRASERQAQEMARSNDIMRTR